MRVVLLVVSLCCGLTFAATPPAEPAEPSDPSATSSTVELSPEQFSTITYALSLIVFAAGVVAGERLVSVK